MKKKSFRIPIGFLAGFLLIWRAEPTQMSYLIGTMIIILGESIRFISSGTLKKFEGVTRNGMYAYTRNPLYIGSFLLGSGACVIGMDPFFSAFFVVFYIILYGRVILREEKYLVGRYGEDYVLYLKEVPRLFPRKIDLPYILSSTSPARAIKNKEGKTLLGITAILLIMLAKLIF